MKLRIALATVLTVFTVIKSQGQIYYTESEDLEDVEAFYLGYENKISFNIFEGVANLSSKNAKITSVPNDPNSFVIVVNSKDSVELEWTSSYTDGSGTNIVKNRSKKIPVRPLPKVELCLGKSHHGDKIVTENIEMNLCLIDSLPKFIYSNYIITNWVVSFESKKKSTNISGHGNDLSQTAVEAILKTRKNKIITISAITNFNEVITSNFIR